MPQDPNDPRVQEFYRQQRLNAQKGAIQGNVSAQNELASIGSKLQRGNAKQQQIGNVDMAEAGRNTQAVKPTNVQDDPLVMALDPLAAGGSVLREILTHPNVAAHVGQAVGTQLVKKMFPDAEEDLMSTGEGQLARTGAKKAAPRVVGKAKVSDVAPKTKALPKKSSFDEEFGKPRSSTRAKAVKGEENPIRGKIRARAKQSGAKIKGAVARRGAKSGEPITARGSTGPKALPKPKGESPKMQHENVSAGVKREKNVRKQQDTARNKGTNPRSKPGYERKKPKSKAT